MPNISMATSTKEGENSRHWVQVAIGVLRKGNQVCLALRQKGQHLQGTWEFPGGKVEVGESPKQALVREFEEEIGLSGQGWQFKMVIPWHYESVSVRLNVFVADYESEVALPEKGKEGQKLGWFSLAELQQMDFPEANQGLITALKLPNLFMNVGSFADNQDALQRYQACLNQGVRLSQLKYKGQAESEFITLVDSLIAAGKESGAKLILNAEPEWLEHCPRVDGLCLSSSKAEQYSSRPINERYLLVISTHSPKQIEHALNLKADVILLSPVMTTSAHADMEPLGWQGFEKIVQQLPIPVYALGGMTLADEKEATEKGGQGCMLSKGLWPDK